MIADFIKKYFTDESFRKMCDSGDEQALSLIFEPERVAEFEKVSEKTFLTDCDRQDVYENIKLPERATTGSAGYDFFAPFDFTLSPHETIKIPTGIRCKINNGYVLMLYPRSSLGFKYHLMLNNTVGVIDSDYYFSSNEGHIQIKMTNMSDKTLNIKAGEGFAQGVFTPYGVTVDDDAQGVRDGGFGSTNK